MNQNGGRKTRMRVRDEDKCPWIPNHFVGDRVILPLDQMGWVATMCEHDDDMNGARGLDSLMEAATMANHWLAMFVAKHRRTKQ